MTAAKSSHRPQWRDAVVRLWQSHGSLVWPAARQRNRSWASDTLIVLPLHSWQLPTWAIGLLAFLGYWGLVAGLSLFEDSASPRDNSRWFGHFPAEQSSGGLDQRIQLPYLSDTTHLLFAIGMSVGAALGATILRSMARVEIDLCRAGVLRPRPPSNTLKYVSYRRWANHPIAKLLALIVAAASWRAASSLISASDTLNWWGNRANGVSGTVMVCVGAFFVYFSMRGFTLLTIGALHVSRLLMQPFVLRPFHPDGCNGIAPIGRIIMCFWAESICIAGMVFVVLHFGYLGLERQWPIWTLAVSGTLAIPLLAILPLVRCVSAVNRERVRRLRAIEPSLMSGLLATEASARLGASAQARQRAGNVDLANIKTTFDVLDGLNVWPFSPRAIFIATVVYVIQLMLTLSQLREVIWP